MNIFRRIKRDKTRRAKPEDEDGKGDEGREVLVVRGGGGDGVG